MPCYFPLKAWRSRDINPGGRRSLVFSRDQGLDGSEIEIACGQCVGCRLERSRQWAVRCVHEAQLHEANCFITLTYSPEHLPSNFSLDKSHFQKFMKRLRKRVGRVRFFHCGEYGETNFRPHYHACLFGYDFPDKQLWTERDGVKLYVSPMLNEIWGMGHCTVGDVTFESAAYVARYIVKKVTGERASEHYQVVEQETGEVHTVEPEYTTMSRRPGIGAGWFRKFGSDVYPSDEVIVRGHPMRPPKYYDGLYELQNPEGLDDVKAKRKEAMLYVEKDNLYRLDVRKKVKMAQLKFLKREV